LQQEDVREHFISDNFLRELNRSGGLRVGGLPWQKPGDVAAIPPSAMTGKILCDRHNSRLSSLDALAGQFFGTLNAIHAACTDGGPAASALSLQIDGHDLERVFLKILLGGAASGNLRGPGGAFLGANVDTLFLKVLFGERELSAPAGLYLLGEPNRPWLVERDIEVAAVALAGEPVAIIVNIAPLRFALALTPEGRNTQILAGKSFFRPAAITVSGPNGINHKIVFRWEGGADNSHVTVGYIAEPPAK
jgi:hypothetical protein